MKIGAAAFLLLIANAATFADNNTYEWAAGAGILAASTPDYRGSKETSERLLPFPFFTFRSRHLNADDDGVRGRLFQSSALELSISLNAALATDADDNRLREGMPEINPSFEIGPALDILLSGSDMRHGLKLRLPLRAAYAFDRDDLEAIGTVFNPQLIYQRRLHNGMRLRLTGGALYGSNRLHDYYYRIAPEYVSAERPRYESNAGYSGFSTGLSLSWRRDRLWYGAYLRYDTLRQAVFVDSPLVETDNYLSGGLALAWILGESN